jgi:GTP cyclohydrolase FolE2
MVMGGLERGRDTIHVVSRNPPVIPADTSPEVWRRQMALIASRSVADRLDEWNAHNQALVKMEVDWIHRRHPEYSQRQLFLALARHRYGDELVRNAWPNESLVEV